MDLEQPPTPKESEWRHSNMSRLLFVAARRFEARLLDVLNARGYPEIRLVHLTVPRNLDMSGTRLTELAERGAMTKQSMGVLVDQCEAMGFVGRRPDPRDRRAKIIAFTPRGLQLIKAIRQAIILVEAEMGSEIGGASLEQARRALLKYCGKNPAETRRRGRATERRTPALDQGQASLKRRRGPRSDKAPPEALSAADE
jgi:DNA-binding MarR family transcriptional regulator